MAGELRKDPTTGKWVLIWSPRPPGSSRDEGETGCPFCPGNEHLTPPAIAVDRAEAGPSGPRGWQVRVIPERDPYFRVEEDLVREGVGMFDRVSSRGASEIVIEDPRHAVTLADADEEQVARVLRMYRSRIEDLQRDLKIRNVVITRRHGKPGARIRHPYSRILATPVIFDELRTELAQAREYFGYKRRCVYCDTIREEIASADRLVQETAHFVAFVPYAARVPFALRVLPRRHACAYEEIGAEEITDLARLLKSLLGGLTKALVDPSYEMFLHTAPNLGAKLLADEWDTVAKDYHWHVEIAPRPEHRTEVGGIAVNEVPPELAAQLLREAGPG